MFRLTLETQTTFAIACRMTTTTTVKTQFLFSEEVSSFFYRVENFTDFSPVISTINACFLIPSFREPMSFLPSVISTLPRIIGRGFLTAEWIGCYRGGEQRGPKPPVTWRNVRGKVFLGYVLKSSFQNVLWTVLVQLSRKIIKNKASNLKFFYSKTYGPLCTHMLNNPCRG